MLIYIYFSQFMNIYLLIILNIFYISVSEMNKSECYRELYNS